MFEARNHIITSPSLPLASSLTHGKLPTLQNRPTAQPVSAGPPMPKHQRQGQRTLPRVKLGNLLLGDAGYDEDRPATEA